MRFGLSEDQVALRDAVRELLDRECPPAVVRAAWAATDEVPEPVAAVWAMLAEMGVLGAAVPEEKGGLGLGACDIVPLLQEAGRVALPLPIVETAFVAAPALVAAGDPGDLLEGVIGGEAPIAASLDGSGLVPFAGRARALLIGGGPGEEIRLTGPETAEPVASLDGARGLHRLAGLNVGEPLELDAAARAAAWDRGVLGTAAHLIGLSRALLTMSVAYVQERRQFGVAIGTFQAVKHNLAGALLGLEFAAPAVLRAAWALDHGAAVASRDVAVAKSLADEAGERVAATALQVHGAIAYTTEYDLHLFAKRIWASTRTWGDSEWQRRRIASMLGLEREETG